MIPITTPSGRLLGTLVNPFRKTLCPNCFERIYLSDCEIQIEAPDPASPDPSNPSYIQKNLPAPQGIDKLIRRFWLPPLIGRKNISRKAARLCPNPKCHKPLPINIERMENRIIGIIGLPRSGKSHYITALIQELQKPDIVEVFGAGSYFRGLNAEVDSRYNTEFYQPLFQRNEPIVFTQGGVSPAPLIYTLAIRGDSPLRPVRRFSLLFYDGSGQDIETKGLREKFARYIYNSAALIYIIDPGELRSIPKEVASALNLPPREATKLPPAKIMDDIARSLRDDSGLMEDAPIPSPTAFTLAKSDLLKYFPGVNETNQTFMRKADYENGFRFSDIDAISSEVEEFVKKYDVEIWNSSQSYGKVRYFAVSATGCGLDPTTNKYPFVEPRRCLDPLFWVLYQLGAVRPKE